MTDSPSSPLGPESPLRGLPTRNALRDLAKTYLTHQHAHWPQLKGTKALPELTDKSLEDLASGYETVYRAQRFSPFNDVTTIGTDIEIGAAYVRYSDSGSNVRSLAQQLINILRTAARENVFIPWNYVFGDAAISGTTTARPGYQLLQSLVESNDIKLDRVVLDELDRLNRDQEDALRFRKLVENHGKRLVTANGFDSTNHMSKMTHTISSLQSELHIDQLKSKVDRGMTDACLQGKHLGQLPFGYKRIPILTESGQPAINRKGKCEMKVMIDEEEAALIRRIFEMYSKAKLSGEKIARKLNQEQALGKFSWGASSIKQMIKNERYIGKQVWKKTRSVMHPKTGKKKALPRPESEHISIEIPETRIVSDKLWNAVRNREQEVSRGPRTTTRSTKSRQAQYPTRLFDLYCRDCDRPLRLDKAGKYASMYCPNGKEEMRACTLNRSKAVRIIDECILAHLKAKLFDKKAMDHLLSQANAFLLEEAAKPPVDVSVLEKQIRSATEKTKRLTLRFADLDDGPAADTLFLSIRQTEALLQDLQSQREMATKSNFRPTPIDMELLKQLVGNLRQLLHEDVVAAHAVLAKAVGKIYVTLGEKRGRSFAWLAEININPVPVLLEIAQRSNCPTTHSLEFLQVRSWTIPMKVSFEINTIANYQRIAAKATQMHENGASYEAIAIALKVDPVTVKSGIEWAKTNDTEFVSDVDVSFVKRYGTSKALQLGPEVAKLRDLEGLSYTAIARQLDTTGALVSRAYKQHHAEQNLAAVSKGETLDSAPRRRIEQDMIDQIRQRLDEGTLSYRAIAREVGCTHWTVRHELKRMKAEPKNLQPPS